MNFELITCIDNASLRSCKLKSCSWLLENTQELEMPYDFSLGSCTLEVCSRLATLALTLFLQGLKMAPVEC